MKRRITELHNEDSKLSKLLFNSSKTFALSLKEDQHENKINAEALEPAWYDQDDQVFSEDINTNQGVHTEKLKQKYETLMGTPDWANLNKQCKEHEDDTILRKVGHLQKTKSVYLPKDFLEIKKFPRINAETGTEGPVISCIEFHPKKSVSLVAGQSGIVSFFTIGDDVNSKLHSFRLKRWFVTSAYFSPDGTKALIASKFRHQYCIYDLVKAEPTLVDLPDTMKAANIFVMSPNGKFIAVSDGLDEVYILCAISKELLKALKHNMNVTSVSFSPDCEQLYSYGTHGEITVWNMLTYRVQQKFYDQGCVTASYMTISPCGKLLATGSGEGIVNIYETSKLNILEPFPNKTISNLTTKISNLRFNATSEILTACSSFYPNAVKLIHIPSYHVFGNFPPQKSNLNQVDVVAFSPGSGYMALGNNKGYAYLYRLKHYKNY